MSLSIAIRSLVLALGLAAIFLPLVRAEKCLIDEDFTKGKTRGARPAGPGEFTAEGWQATSETDQIVYDLGAYFPHASVEFDIKGPLRQARKHSLFSAWNEEAGADGDRKSQNFFQMRLFREGMMLRLTNRAGGRSFEGLSAPLDWAGGWVTMRGEWNTGGGESHLWRDGTLLKSGRFNAVTPGLRWVFIGKDNYQQFRAIPGMTYKYLKVCIK